jgi:hypothetical protein
MASGELLTSGKASEEQDPLNKELESGNFLTVVNKSTQPIKNIQIQILY